MLRASRRSGASVLIASSSEVYGKNASAMVSESSTSVFGSPTASRWSYGISKWAEEFLGRQHHEVSGLPVVSVRLFNIIGPRQVEEHGMVVPRFIRQASGGQPITVYDDGAQRRAFCSVHDVAPALVTLLRNVDSHGLSVNLGSALSVSVLELAEAVRDATGSDSEIEFVRYAEAYGAGFEGYNRSLPELSLAQRLIDFRSRVTLAEALAELWELRREPDVS